MNASNGQSLNKLFLLLLAVYGVLMLVWIDTGPKVWVDESWEAIPGSRLAFEGRIDNPVLSGSLAREEHLLDPQMTYYALLAGAFKIIGFGIYAGRFVSVVAGLFAVLLTFLLARRYFGDVVGLLAAVMLMINNVAFVSAATIRPEAAVAAITLAALYFLLRGLDEERHGFIALSGLLIGIGLHVHPNSALGAMSLIVVLLVHQGPSVVLRSLFWLFAAYLVIGFLPYAIYVFLEDAGNGFEHFMLQISNRAQPLAEGNVLLRTIQAEISRYTQYVFFPKRVLIALLEAAAILWALFRGDRASRLLAIVVLVHLALFPFLIVNKTARYLTVLMPMASILVAVLLCNFASVTKRPWREIPGRIRGAGLPALVCVLLSLGYLGNQFAGDAWLVWKNRHNDYADFTARLDEHIPDSARVWGSMTFWVGLHEHPYRTQYTYTKDLETFRPEYVIMYDGDIWKRQGGVTGRERVNSEHQEVRERIEGLVAEKGSFVAKVEDPVYGVVEIHRIDW
jgi:hypothetical protein